MFHCVKKALVGLLGCLGVLWANERPNVAVLPFNGDQSVTAEQLSFITGKFATELAASGEFQLLDRSRIDFILQEQGFQQSGTCNGAECRMQMGQMLGVDHVVSGTLVRFGSRYAFRADYVNVSNGKVDYSVEQKQDGDLEDVYEALCQRSARQLADLVRLASRPIESRDAEAARQASVDATSTGKTPSAGLSTKRKIALGLWGGSLLGVGSGAYFQTQASAAQDDYDAAWSDRDYPEAKAAYADYEDARSVRNTSFAVSAGAALVGAVLWFWPE